MLDTSPSATLTSERVTASLYQDDPQAYLNYLFHVTAYKFCLPHVRSKRVLDFGCGTGYGTAILAPQCDAVVGVDISEDAIAYANTHHAASNATFQPIHRVEERPLPFSDGSFDVVVSLQVIEHLKDPRAYLSETCRVLSQAGILIVATPDRRTRLFGFQRPWNPFHVTEYGSESLSTLLAADFPDIEMFQMTGSGAVLDAERRRVRAIRFLSLPLTLPIVPEPLRRVGLRGLSAAKNRIKLTRRQSHRPTGHPFTENSVFITKTSAPGLSLLAVARKAGAARP